MDVLVLILGVKFWLGEVAHVLIVRAVHWTVVHVLLVNAQHRAIPNVPEIKYGDRLPRYLQTSGYLRLANK